MHQFEPVAVYSGQIEICVRDALALVTLNVNVCGGRRRKRMVRGRY